MRRFLSLERSLHSKGEFEDFNAVMTEYFEMGHAETVPSIDLKKANTGDILSPNAICEKGVEYYH